MLEVKTEKERAREEERERENESKKLKKKLRKTGLERKMLIDWPRNRKTEKQTKKEKR